MTEVLPAAGVRFDARAQVIVIGAGACGLTAALAARDRGQEVVVLERDRTPSGSTSLSSGFVPAAPTRYQNTLGIEDTAEIFFQDIERKTKGGGDQDLARLVVDASAETLEWLDERHGLEWTVLDDFLYPGHTRHRMHAVPERTGAALMARLLGAIEREGVTVATDRHVTALYADGDRVCGVRAMRPDGEHDIISCNSVILACNGYGGNPELVREHIPDMSDALYFGHAGNQGDAVLWGRKLGAATRHLSGYQGHGSVAHPHGILVTWALMMEGGIQVNTDGVRFSNEHEGYSEQAGAVLSQPGGVAWNIYDEWRHEIGMTFDDYRTAYGAGAVTEAASLEELADLCRLPLDALVSTVEEVQHFADTGVTDRFGRTFSAEQKLEPPWCAVKVTGALFHTQGGLVVDRKARVVSDKGTPIAGLYAGGGAACGVSGPAPWGYLSGNGLLTAMTLGRIAGLNAD